MISINKYHDTIKHNFYNSCLMDGVKNKQLKIKDLTSIKKSNYSFQECFTTLRRTRSLNIFFNMFLHSKHYFLNEKEEELYRKTIVSQLNFCINNISDNEFKKLGWKQVERNYLFNFNHGYNNTNNKDLFETTIKFFKKFCSCSQCTKIGNDKILCKQHPRRADNDCFVLNDPDEGVSASSRKVKIGIVCNQIFNELKPVYRDRNEIIKNLNNDWFDVSIVSSVSENKFYPNATLIQCTKENVVDKVMEQNFDIIFYPEIGMDFFAMKCAVHRCAPVQVATWGHSDTTGMHTIDYYISSEYFNKESDFVYFTEKLVRMKSLGTYYNSLESIVDNEDHEAIYKQYNINKNIHIYNCTQVPLKTTRYENVFILLKLLERDPRALILLIYTSQGEYVFFRKVFEKIDEKRVRLYPYLNKKEYQKLLLISDILVDPYPFGSLNTTLDAFKFKKVILSLPSLKINGNFCSGFYKKMGMTELICSCMDEYITKAIRLTSDREYHDRLRDEIQDKMSVLFKEQKSIDEYNAFFRNLCVSKEWAGANVDVDIDVDTNVDTDKKEQKLETFNHLQRLRELYASNDISYYPDAIDGSILRDRLHTNMNYTILKIISSGGIKERYGVDIDTVYVDRYNIAWIMIKDCFYAHGLALGKFIFGLSDKDTVFIAGKIQDKVILQNERIMPMIEYKTVLDDYKLREKANGSGKLVHDSALEPTGKEVITWMIAVYNRADVVGETLTSLLNQTNQEFKCIICDDGSTDNSLEIVCKLVGRDPRFTIYTKQNGGIVDTSNYMSSKVETEVMATLDSDDVLMPDANNILLNVYRNHKCSAVYSGYHLCDRNLNVNRTIIHDFDSNAIVGPNINPTNNAKELLISNPFEHLRTWRTKCLPFGAFPPYLLSAEDQDIAYRFEEMGRSAIYNIQEPLVKFRRGFKNSLMHNKKTHIESRQHHYKAKLAALQRRNVLL